MSKFINLKWQLNLEQTLLGGQSFRWSKNGTYFIGVTSNIVWKLRLAERKLFYDILGELPPLDSDKRQINPHETKCKLLYNDDYYCEILTKYFRLESNLEADYMFWIEAHKHFKTRTSKDEALITQLNQDVVETIFSFICSQNNHITRISSLVEKLCITYGEKICTIDNKDYYSFPASKLSTNPRMEAKLRELGFGYRAKYIDKAAKEIFDKGGISWLNSLSKKSYIDAHNELMKIPGIGPKVADCICLMSLNFLEAVPVDTHIIQVAQHYIEDDSLKKVKSLNMKLYRKIGDTFRSVYGSKAGVAQTVLFCKELSKFSDENGPLKKKTKGC